MVLLLAGVPDSEVDDGPVRAGIIGLGGPERAYGISDRQPALNVSEGIIIRQHLGSVGLLSEIEDAKEKL